MNWSIVLGIIFLFYNIVTGISNGNENPAADEETDTDLINSYLETQNKSKSDTLSHKSGLPNVTTEACQCVKYYLCDPADVIKKGNSSVGTGGSDSGSPDAGVSSGDILGIVDIREGLKTGVNSTVIGANGCPHYFDVCCKHVKSEVAPTVSPEEPKVTIKNFTNWTHKGCGHRNENGIGFKVTGTTGGESQFGEFPWTVAVVQQEVVVVDGPNGIKENATRNVFLCGGSLLTPQTIITAAHCVFSISNSESRKHLYVRVGEWDTSTTDEPFPHQDRFVKQVILHEELYRKGLYNDVALLILEKPVKLAPNVDTLCLPPVGSSVSEFDGQTCFSSGWGKNSFGAEGRYQEIMKKVEVAMIPRKTCETELRKTRLSDSFRLHDSFVCAGGDAKHDTCVGDGGSPLVCKKSNFPNTYEVQGIVAWGIGCQSSVPAVYVNVVKFVPWILEKMKQNHVDASFCTI